jgi:uncharacterized protein (TIGR03083 family)
LRTPGSRQIVRWPPVHEGGIMDLAAIRRAIGDLNRAFVADMAALPDGTWQQPSDCAGWTIAGAVIHLAQVAELLGDAIARGRAGDPGPPPLAAKEGVQAWRAWRAGVLADAQTKSPRELLAWYGRASAAIDAELDAIPTAEPEARGWHPIGAQPLSWVQDQWLFELALHDWDIRVALDPATDVRPSAQGAFARTLPARIGRGFGGGGDPALAGLYRFQLDSAAPFTVSARVGDGGLAIVSDEAGAPDVTIQTDPSAFGLVATNRRPVERFESAGRWQVAGDAARASGFAQAFKSY